MWLDSPQKPVLGGMGLMISTFLETRGEFQMAFWQWEPPWDMGPQELRYIQSLLELHFQVDEMLGDALYP